MGGIGTPAAAAWPELLAAAPAVARHRARTALRRAGWGGAPRRRWVAAIAPALGAAAEPVTVDGAAPDWFTENVTVTDTAVVVALVRSRNTGRDRVVKMPCTAEGAESLGRQATILATLHADARLTGWIDVVPRQCGAGDVAGRRYWVEDAVPGVPISGRAPQTSPDGPIFAAAVRLIQDLHDRTGDERAVDTTDVAAWVLRPLRAVESHYARRPRHLAALQRIGARLSDDLAGRQVRTSWIHGDFWPGNLLVTGSAVTGVVDWDRAAADQLPFQDLLHLAFFTERARTGCELGDLVVRWLRDGPQEAIGVTARQLDAWLGGVSPASAALLFWLRHISLYIGSEGHGDNRGWLRHNVDGVLAGC